MTRPEYLTTTELKQLRHLPYSPGLPPCGLALCLDVKMKLKGRRRQEPFEGLGQRVPYSETELGRAGLNSVNAEMYGMRWKLL